MESYSWKSDENACFVYNWQGSSLNGRFHHSKKADRCYSTQAENLNTSDNIPKYIKLVWTWK